jgi:hypothetical protein
VSVDRDKERVLRLFERHRKTPGAPFDESHFLDYLLARPKRRHAVYNSFTGLRRFNAFIDAVQLEFSVFFSVKDREANYSLQKFVERVGQLKSSPRSSLASLRNSKRRGFGWHTVVLLNVVALLICLVMFRHVPTLATGSGGYRASPVVLA